VIRERRSAAFKKKVALEAIREKKTINEIASAFDVHPVQVGKWKKQLLEGLDDIFESSSRKKKDSNNLAAIDGSLHEKIGRLTMELDWLKKSLSMSNMDKRQLIEPEHDALSVSRQLERGVRRPHKSSFDEAYR
jgi:transposase-like protein